MTDPSHRYETINQRDSPTNLAEQDETSNPILRPTSMGREKQKAPPRAPPPVSWFCSSTFYFTLGYMIMAVAMIVGFILLKQEITQLQTELNQYQQSSADNYQRLMSEFNLLNSEEIQFQNSTKVVLGTQENMLNRLNNGTSNADVLDKLKQTKLQVTAQLATSNQQMIDTQNDINRHLNITLGKMESVVTIATMSIHAVQANVSAQLDTMRLTLGATVNELNTQVQTAQDIIHDEVAVVKANIDTYVAVTNQQFAAENDFVKYQLAGTFTLLGCLISMWHLTSHLRHYYKPDVQRRVMAVLWMVPIYSITSWLSLVLPSSENIFAAIRDCYEAYAIYTFIALLIAILEDGKGLSELINKLTHHILEERAAITNAANAIPRQPKPKEHIKPPFGCCYVTHRPSTIATAWLYQCKLMAMQFVMLKPVLTIVPLIITLCGYNMNTIPLNIGHYPNWNSPRLYILILENFSVAVAFWGLLCFYHGTEKDLEWCDPWPKFLCIKGVVFATFWQSLTIQFMSSFGFVDEHTGSQISNLLICIEMLIASLAHFYIFPYQEWADDYKREREKGIMLRDTLALRDFVKDMRMMVTTWDVPGGTTSVPAGGTTNNTSTVDPQQLLSPYTPPRVGGDENDDDEHRRLIWDTDNHGIAMMDGINDVETGQANKGGFMSNSAAAVGGNTMRHNHHHTSSSAEYNSTIQYSDNMEGEDYFQFSSDHHHHQQPSHSSSSSLTRPGQSVWDPPLPLYQSSPPASVYSSGGSRGGSSNLRLIHPNDSSGIHNSSDNHNRLRSLSGHPPQDVKYVAQSIESAEKALLEKLQILSPSEKEVQVALAEHDQHHHPFTADHTHSSSGGSVRGAKYYSTANTDSSVLNPLKVKRSLSYSSQSSDSVEEVNMPASSSSGSAGYDVRGHNEGGRQYELVDMHHHQHQRDRDTEERVENQQAEDDESSVHKEQTQTLSSSEGIAAVSQDDSIGDNASV